MTDMHTGLCTCHYPARPMSRPDAQHEWAHDDTDDYAEVFHVHSDSHSTDCDGPMDRSHTWQLSNFDTIESKDDLWRTLVRMEVTPYALHQQITIDGPNYTAEFGETTDEGGHSVTLRGCTDADCAHDRDTQRDYYAEQMGY